MTTSTISPAAIETRYALQLQDVSVDARVERNWVRVVDHVNVTVAPGETVGLVGESGSGKTLTSLAVMSLLPSNCKLGTGKILLDGESLSDKSPRQLGRIRGNDIAMIFQEPRRSLNGVFTVGDQIAESVRRHSKVSRKDAWKRAVELLDRVGIPEAARRAHQYPFEFSGGMCQRVMLAIAIASSPKVLVADEPTTALDVTVQRQVLELMADLQKEMGLGILLITHDLGVVAEVCDRVTVMYAGQVVEQAPVEPLFASPQHPYSYGLLSSSPESAVAGESLGYIPGIVPPPSEFTETCRFATRCFAVKESCTERALDLVTVNGRDVRCARVDNDHWHGGVNV
jgi:peptide/nickel transport system ATP-binding protein